MAATIKHRASAAEETGPIFPLENGDRLSREEFLRRWEAMPHLKRAERIEGVVYVQAAVRAREHSNPHGRLITWLGVYEAMTRGVELGNEGTILLDSGNEPQPDGSLRILKAFGGRTRVNKGGLLVGAPELVAETAASSATRDLHDKFDVYCRNGVNEYIVWKVLEEEVLWFRLRKDRYVPLKPDKSGIFQSKMFPGLWLDGAALVGGDMARVLEVLHDGLASAAHAAFVKKLQSKGEKS